MAKNSKIAKRNPVDVKEKTGPRKTNVQREIGLDRPLESTLSPKQQEFEKLIHSNTIVICTGPAGTSKTYSACFTALDMLIRKHVDRIVLTKPIIEVGEKLGALPGEVANKIEPYLFPLLK